jgi:cardiolipin synthase
MFLICGLFDFAEIWTLLTIVYQFLVVLTLVVLIFERREPVVTMAWIMVIAMFPVGGMILYVVLGRNHRRRRRFMGQKLWGEEPCVESVEGAPLTLSNSRQVQLVCNNSRSPLTLHNRVDVLHNGEECFPRMFGDMARAEHSLHVEFFGIESGALFEQMFEVLSERAAAGVEVRVIYDSIGGRLLRRRDLRRLRCAGVDVRCFMPIFSARFVGLLNYRNHRKIVVIDGRVAYTGGMNIADRYLYGVRGGILRDVHLRIEGEAVAKLQRVFTADWAFVTDGVEIVGERYFPPTAIGDLCPMQIATSGPDSPYAAIRDALFAAISKAERYIYISTPYLLPDAAITTALTVAAQSGVEVRILIPVRGDNIAVAWAGYSYVEEFLRAGIRIYLYRRGFVHSKFVVTDDEFCSIGTTNLDYRSFNDDFEVQTFIYDHTHACSLRERFLLDLEDAEEITLDSWATRSRLSKVMEPLARLFAPIF